MTIKNLKLVDATEPSYQNYSNDSTTSLDQQKTDSSNDEKVSCCTKFKTALFLCGAHYKSLRIEVVAFLALFSTTMTTITSTTLILEKVCLLNFNQSSNVCSHLEDYTDFKTHVEKIATNYQLGHSLIQILPATIFTMLIGPWSDHYGRKIPLLLALTGLILDAAGSTVCGYLIYSRTEYYFIPPIFSGLSGGFISIMAIVYSHASDTTTLAQRTLKYAFLALYIGLGEALGALAGGWLFNFFSYPAVYFFSALGFGLCFIWVALRVPETRGLDNEDTWKTKIKNLYSCEAFKESCRAITKERPHRGRIQVIMLIICVCFLIVAKQSTNDINYLYVFHKFGWTNTVYSTITTVYTCIAVLMYFIVLPLMKKFNASDATLGIMGSVSLLVKNIGVGLAFEKWIFHLGSILGLLNGFGLLACQSRISKAVSTDDLAKIFSFVATAESLFPVIFSIAMTQTYTHCIDFFPGMPYLILAAFVIMPLITFIWLLRVKMPKL